MSEQDPFGREEFLDKPGIVGARWWQRSLEAADVDTGRRAVIGLFAAGAVLTGVGMIAAVAGASSGSDDYRTEARAALDLQQEYGWSFGATAEPLTFDGTSKRPFARDALGKLADDLRPSVTAHVPFYVPTLFQAPSALQRNAAAEDPVPSAPLRDVLQPIFTPAMDVAYRRGKALAALFTGATPPLGGAVLVVVDLPGPESIAFAAGAVAAFDPVFAIDNWPHPRGVVPAHQTLAAAAYYQPLFARRAGKALSLGALPPDPRLKAPPGQAAAVLPAMVVLDRRRLDAYTDDSSQFDNRHVARVPGAAALKAQGVSRVLYVTPAGTDKDLDDLNDDLVLYGRAGLTVKLVGADAFGRDAHDGAGPASGPDDDRPFYYYGSRIGSSGWFWHDYPWIKASPAAPGTDPEQPTVKLAGVAYAPALRVTPFSSGNPGAARPTGFGTVPVIISVATGLVLGAKLFRSGSWNRAAGGWGG